MEIGDRIGISSDTGGPIGTSHCLQASVTLLRNNQCCPFFHLNSGSMLQPQKCIVSFYGQIQPGIAFQVNTSQIPSSGTGTTGLDRYTFNGQIDRNIINCDTALDV